MYLSNPLQVITENENFVLFTLLQHYGIAIRLITSSGASAGLKDAEPGKLQATVSAIAVSSLRSTRWRAGAPKS
jgi:hypothetical protein